MWLQSACAEAEHYGVMVVVARIERCSLVGRVPAHRGHELV